LSVLSILLHGPCIGSLSVLWLLPTSKESTRDMKVELDEYDIYHERLGGYECSPRSTIWRRPIKIYVDGELIAEFAHPDSVYSDFRAFVLGSDSDSLAFTAPRIR